MKNFVVYIPSSIIFLLGAGCDNNVNIDTQVKTEEKTEVTTDDTCGSVKGKFVWNWCTQFGVIEILSDKSMGADWNWGTKKYHNAVLAKLDSTLLKNKENWSSIVKSSDSIVYFNYASEQFDYGVVCKVLGGPEKTISITSFASRPCPN